MPRPLVASARQGCTFESAHNSVPRVVLGLSTFCWAPSQSKSLCALAVRHPTAIEFDLEIASENLSGNITPVCVAIDPHIAEIYVKENEHYPQTAESHKERYAVVNDPFLGFLKNKGYVGHPHDLEEYGVTYSEDPPTVIIWIDHFRFDGGFNQGGIAIDQEKLLSEKGLYKAITVSGGFHGVSMSWFSFSSAALNIYGGNVPVNASNGTIKVPVSNILARPKIIVGVSGWQWKNHHGNPDQSGTLSDYEAYGQHELSFAIVVDEKSYKLEAGNHVFTWRFSRCHIDCISEVNFSWVAVSPLLQCFNLWAEQNQVRERAGTNLSEGDSQEPEDTITKSSMDNMTLQDKGGMEGARSGDIPEAKQGKEKEKEESSQTMRQVATEADELFAQKVERTRGGKGNMSDQEREEAAKKFER